MRRVNVNGGNLSLMDYCSAGPQYASGGFIADSSFSGGTRDQRLAAAVLRPQHQPGRLVERRLEPGLLRRPGRARRRASPARPAGQRPTRTPRWPPRPQTQEEPFLQTDAAPARTACSCPSLQQNSSGPSWASGTHRGHVPADQRVLRRHPEHLDRGHRRGAGPGQEPAPHPGRVQHRQAPILVKRPDTVVLGLGFATLIPQNGTAAIDVAGRPAASKLSGLIFDAGPKNSPRWSSWAPRSPASCGSASDPALVQDVFFRIGGAHRRQGHRQPGGQQRPRDPGRHLGLAGRPRRRPAPRRAWRRRQRR